MLLTATEVRKLDSNKILGEYIDEIKKAAKKDVEDLFKDNEERINAGLKTLSMGNTLHIVLCSITAEDSMQFIGKNTFLNLKMKTSMDTNKLMLKDNFSVWRDRCLKAIEGRFKKIGYTVENTSDVLTTVGVNTEAGRLKITL